MHTLRLAALAFVAGTLCTVAAVRSALGRLSAHVPRPARAPPPLLSLPASVCACLQLAKTMELEECTFKPAISARAKRRESSEPAWQRLSAVDHAAALKAREDAKARAELEACTFKPEVRGVTSAAASCLPLSLPLLPPMLTRRGRSCAVVAVCSCARTSLAARLGRRATCSTACSARVWRMWPALVLVPPAPPRRRAELPLPPLPLHRRLPRAAVRRRRLLRRCSGASPRPIEATATAGGHAARPCP